MRKLLAIDRSGPGTFRNDGRLNLDEFRPKSSQVKFGKATNTSCNRTKRGDLFMINGKEGRVVVVVARNGNL